MQAHVTDYCLVASGACIIAFAIVTVFGLFAQLPGDAVTAAKNAANARGATDPISDVAKLFERLSGLVANLTKAGPGLSALAAAVFFAAIAAYSSQHGAP